MNSLVNEILELCRHDCRNFIAFPNEKVSHEFFDKLNNHLTIYYPKYEDVFLRFFLNTFSTLFSRFHWKKIESFLNQEKLYFFHS